jgi:hypothetical protein
MISERIDGPTPNGGTYAIAYYQDEAGEATDKDAATAVEIVEFDGDDNEIFRTYGELIPQP